MRVFSMVKIKDYALLYLGFVIYSFVSVFAKFAAGQTDYKMLVFFCCEIILLVLYAVLWQQVLKKFPLVVAMSSKGITVILSLLWAVLIFKESVTYWNIVGSAMIMFGIWMVSSDG